MTISIAASSFTAAAAAEENQNAIWRMSNSTCIDLFVDYYNMGIMA